MRSCAAVVADSADTSAKASNLFINRVLIG
jgi:hypothetical protein